MAELVGSPVAAIRLVSWFERRLNSLEGDFHVELFMPGGESFVIYRYPVAIREGNPMTAMINTHPYEPGLLVTIHRNGRDRGQRRFGPDQGPGWLDHALDFMWRNLKLPWNPEPAPPAPEAPVGRLNAMNRVVGRAVQPP